MHLHQGCAVAFKIQSQVEAPTLEDCFLTILSSSLSSHCTEAREAVSKLVELEEMARRTLPDTSQALMKSGTVS